MVYALCSGQLENGDPGPFFVDYNPAFIDTTPEFPIAEFTHLHEATPRMRRGMTTSRYNFSTYTRYPSPTLYGQYLSAGGEYYGQFTSQFVPAGYGAFYVSPLNTRVFNCPSSGNCTFP